MDTIIVEYNAKNRIVKGLLWVLSKIAVVKKMQQPLERQRIPVSKIYWAKGTYKELVEDPFNLKK